MATTNIVEAILGRKAIKWDAFWHLFEWLIDPEEGHGLGEALRKELLLFAFDQHFPSCIVKREYPVSGQTDGKGKWADLALGIPSLREPDYLVLLDDIPYSSSGGQRKLVNLNAYLDESLKRCPNALVRAIAVTDAPVGLRLAVAVERALGAQATDSRQQRGWKLLNVSQIGSWINSAIAVRGDHVEDKMRTYLQDVAAWCHSHSETRTAQMGSA
jgi:hypothetical protein